MKIRAIAFLILLLIVLSALLGCELRPDVSETPPPSAPASVAVIPTPDPPPKKVGISLPDQNLRRWVQDGALMKQRLEEDGFIVDLRYASNDVETQVSQLDEMITTGCDVLLITAIDGSALTEVLTPTKNKGITVIAYDRLIMESEAVSYYVTYDRRRIGGTMGRYLKETLNLDNRPGPFNIELFVGSLDDCAMIGRIEMKQFLDLLQPNLDNRQVIVPSGQIDYIDTGVHSWEPEAARARMESLIASQGYGPDGTKLDAVICQSDWLAQGVTQALLDAGYTEKDFPVVTGMDCDVDAVKNIIKGTQSMSVYWNHFKLAERAVIMAEDILDDQEPEINESEEYYNSVKTVPTYVCDYDIVTRENYRELLVDSGYYTEAEIEGLEIGDSGA